jgi:L-histidine Nalpha-methyltransferase
MSAPVSLDPTEDAVAELTMAVEAGLNARPRRLPSRFFYDDAGSRLFQEIMSLPEYYLTRAEFALLEQQGAVIVEALRPSDDVPFHLVELGAGDGLKTRLLLHELMATDARFTYIPIDISKSALDGLTDALRSEIPSLAVTPLVAEYATGLASLRTLPGRKVVLFLGSNIGNFDLVGRRQFLQALAAHLTPDDRLLIGFDLQKDPRRIHAAYDDAQRVTAEFNLNLLRRLNRELGADFDLVHWGHYPSYDPLTGAMRSFLVSRQEQTVWIEVLQQSFAFDAWEAIHTEDSWKFTLGQITSEAADAGLRVVAEFVHPADLFADVVLAVAD